jgi:hypothetical protein
VAVEFVASNGVDPKIGERSRLCNSPTRPASKSNIFDHRLASNPRASKVSARNSPFEIVQAHWGVVNPGGTLIVDHNGSALNVTAKFGSGMSALDQNGLRGNIRCWQSRHRPNIRFFESAHWCRGGWQPVAVWAALQALLAGATLAVKAGGKDRANGHAGR